MGSPEAHSPLPEELNSSSENTTGEPTATDYQPLTTLEETLDKIGALLELPAEGVTDMQIFEVIADTFVTRCEEYRRAGIKDEMGEDIEWQREDERGFATNGERDFTIAYYAPQTSIGVTEAWFEDKSTNSSIIIDIHGGQLEISETDFGVEPETDTELESIPAETKTRILSRLQQGLNSPLGNP